jgi:hypothetical protein
MLFELTPLDHPFRASLTNIRSFQPQISHGGGVMFGLSPRVPEFCRPGGVDVQHWHGHRLLLKIRTSRISISSCDE